MDDDLEVRYIIFFKSKRRAANPHPGKTSEPLTGL